MTLEKIQDTLRCKLSNDGFYHEYGYQQEWSWWIDGCVRFEVTGDLDEDETFNSLDEETVQEEAMELVTARFEDWDESPVHELSAEFKSLEVTNNSFKAVVEIG